MTSVLETLPARDAFPWKIDVMIVDTLALCDVRTSADLFGLAILNILFSATRDVILERQSFYKITYDMQQLLIFDTKYMLVFHQLKPVLFTIYLCFALVKCIIIRQAYINESNIFL